MQHCRTYIQLGMGTRRPGTRQDLGPGTSRGLAEESRDFLYILLSHA